MSRVARRTNDDSAYDDGMLSPMDPGTDAMLRASSSRKKSAPVQPPRLKIVLRVLGSAVVLGAGLYGFNRVEQFLIRDPRFALNGTDGTASTLEIHGATHASSNALEAAFRDDSGRSVYLMPLAARRTALRNVDWVKDAAVARAWPNRVLVKVSERTPVAFVALTPARFGLIDEEGVILPPAPDRFHLPVLIGAGLNESIAERKKRVRRMTSLMASLGPSAADIAEVDVSDSSNLVVKQPSGGHMVTLLLGDRDFAVRYQNFVAHFSEIRQKLPGAAALDLRLEDRITVVDQ
jgi:cell division protein FtsQ